MTSFAGPSSSAPLSIDAANSLKICSSTALLRPVIYPIIFVYSLLRAMTTDTVTSSKRMILFRRLSWRVSVFLLSWGLVVCPAVFLPEYFV